MQGSKIDTDVRNRHSDSGGEGEAGRCERTPAEPCLLPYKADDRCKVRRLRQALRAVLGGTAGGKGGDGVRGSGWGHTPLADSCRF